MKKEPIPIYEAKPGQKVRLSHIEAGQGLKQRLAAMGVLPDSELIVIRSISKGQVIIKVKESRVVLGRGMANKIFVV